MSRLVARILLAIFMFPLAAIVYVVSAVTADRYLRFAGGYSSNWFLVAGFVTWVAVATYWCLLWRTSVRWDFRRRVGTLAAALLATLVGLGAGIACYQTLSRDGDFGSFVGGVLTIMLWLVATVFVWRETTAERAARVSASGSSAVACPTCGYNLTGLGEARCPECGSRFTLDELLAAQPARAAAADLE